MRVFYIDHSGVDNQGWVIFGWVEFLLDDWSAVLGHRLGWRKALNRDLKIPASYHLHTAEFLGNRGEPPSLDADWNAGSKKFIRRKRIAVLEQALQNVNTCPALGLGVAHRHTAARGKAFALDKQEVYARLVQHLDARSAATARLGC